MLSVGKSAARSSASGGDEYTRIANKYPIIAEIATGETTREGLESKIREFLHKDRANRDVLQRELTSLQVEVNKPKGDSNEGYGDYAKLRAISNVYSEGPLDRAISKEGTPGSVNIDQIMNALNDPTQGGDTAESYKFEDLRACINTVETALRGTNWEQALNDATRLAFSCLWVGFSMARHAHPTFPSMADWGVLARMKTPLLSKRCLYERQNRKFGEPQWDASCFHEGQLVLGTDDDSEQLYVRTKSGRWSRVQLAVSPDIKDLMIKQLKSEQTRYTGDDDDSTRIDNELWEIIGQTIK